MTLRYPVKLEADDNGTVLATCPSLPEVTTFGEDDADALAHAVGAIEEALAARIADGEDIPPPPERPRGRSVALPRGETERFAATATINRFRKKVAGRTGCRICSTTSEPAEPHGTQACGGPEHSVGAI